MDGELSVGRIEPRVLVLFVEAVEDAMCPVLHPPVIANDERPLLRGQRIRRVARREVAIVARDHLAVVAAHDATNPHRGEPRRAA